MFDGLLDLWYTVSDSQLGDVTDWQPIVAEWQRHPLPAGRRTNVVLSHVHIVDAAVTVPHWCSVQTLTSDLTTRLCRCRNRLRISTASRARPSDTARSVDRRRSHSDHRNYELFDRRRRRYTLGEGCPRDRDRRRADQWSAVRITWTHDVRLQCYFTPTLTALSTQLYQLVRQLTR